MKRIILSAVLVAAACGLANAGATYQEPGFADTTFVSSTSLGNITTLAWAPDGSRRLFAARKAGEIRIVKAGALLATPWATMSPIHTTAESGLLGLCFDPNFLANRYVYVFVTVSSTEQQILRYTDEPANDTGGNRTVIMPGLPTSGTNHNAGCVQIGPDGKLYWSVGNINASGQAAGGENGSVLNLASKIGRANLDGTAPFDNPYYDGAGPSNDYVWARGLRNAFRFQFQPATGKLWANCVGDGYEQIFQMNARDDAGDRTRENIQDASRIAPQIKYRTNSVSTDTKTIAASNGAVRSNNIVTFTTTANHGYRKGENITVSGVSDASFNGQFYVASTPSPTTFTVEQTGANASSGNGTIVPLQISTGTSAAVTGGVFYDGTLFPAKYRGNYFFGDAASGRIVRATLDTDNSVKNVDYFATGAQQFVDITTGPDGAMYFVGHNTTGAIFRIAPSTLIPAIVLSPANLRVIENGSAMLNVCLAVAPAGGSLDVNLERAGGDTGITFTPSMLTFTSANFSTPQQVLISAAKDANIVNDSATIEAAAAGLAAETVLVTAIDIDASTVVLSSTSVALTEGQTGSFTIALPSQPASNVTVNLARTGDTDVTVTSSTTLTYTNADWNQPQTVMLAAAIDADNTNDSATIQITGTGLAPGTVAVTVADNSANAPQFTTSPVTAAVLNAPYVYFAGANGFPPPTFSLESAPNGMTISSTTGRVDWTPGSLGNFGVTVRASNGVPPDATQTFTINVSADQPPTAVISKPAQNEIISGTNTEFYGNGVDDVNTVRAEFHVDNVLKYTDNAQDNHFHIFGSHLLFDTTIYSNGPHKLKMTVYDTANQFGSQEIDVTIENPSVVTSGSSAGTVGVLFSYQVQATNQPTNYSATGLPNGLAIDIVGGLISGTPSQSGTFTVNLSVTNVAGVSTGTLILTIVPAPVLPPVVTGGSANATVGKAFHFQIAATNSPDSYGATGLPAGLSVTANSGAISGMPEVSGAFTVNLSATNAGGTGSATLTISVSPNRPPAIASGISASPQPLRAGIAATLTASAVDPDGDAVVITWNFGDGGSGSGSAVTHTFVVSGMYAVQVTASDGLGGATAEILLPVYPALTQTSPFDVIALKTAALKMSFAPVTKRNSLKLAGTFPAPPQFNPAGAQVTVKVGAFEHTYTLDSRGSSTDKKLKLLGWKSAAPLKFSLTIEGTHFAALASEFPNANVSIQITLPMAMTIGSQTRLQLVTLSYTAKAGKSATGKLAK